ncbi:hypothetical protein [Flagellimonas lutaonensis]|uniref:Lipoprotein n=1 Tax=Flagellimonas lutaonensis TaxID=516051 RepID=A0A0D5YWZ9_9FLAO|nr:hypothetical protein [Allomuricauda lutaonensis]AKA36378.1 hypothetical protein VC82_2832 [Allomuricauda lutaonensis]
MRKLKDVFKLTMLFGVVALLFVACSDDAEDATNDVAITEAELKTVLESDQAASAVDAVLAEMYQDNGNSNKSSAKGNECYAAEYTENGFTATFNNCVLNGTDNINGTLDVTYVANSESAAFTATYTDFYVGTLKLNGTRTFMISEGSNGNSVAFTVTSNMSVETEAGEVVSESGTKTLTVTFDEGIFFSVAGSWTVQADGHTYAVETIEDLQGQFGCAHLTDGSMTLNKNGLEVTVDFGDGTCDDKATVTYPNGTQEEFAL